MSVNRLFAEVYVIRPKYEYAAIYLRHWTTTRNGEECYCGEIAINSSFGTYANSWGHCGVEFKRFLAGLDFGYFMEKCRPSYKRFDFDESIKAIRQRTIECRRQGDIDKPKARAIWNGLRELDVHGTPGAHAFVDGLYDIEALRHITTEPYEWACEIPDPDSRGFWREVWPLFLAELETERTQSSRGAISDAVSL